MRLKLLSILSVIAVGLTFFQSSPVAQAASAPTAACNPDCVITMPYLGDYYSWTVPSGITSITVDAYGAQGGKSSCSYNTVASGGLGGRVQAKLTTTPGETLYIFVGGQGNSASQTSISSSPGWNGGGKGGYGNGSGYWGSGGGGATDIRTSISDTSTRILVAGAGGGAACQNNTTSDNGGAGGGLVGGVSGQVASGTTTSLGGTQSAGGAGITWSGWGPSKAGSLGQGGDAQLTDVSSNSNYVNGGGGGGGGYFGGGGGSWVGGGGGSSYTSPIRASLVSHTQGARTGNGVATISYAIPVPVITASIAGNANSVRKGETIQLTSNVDQAGKVTFLADGKRIAGCIGITTSGGNVTCNWKPTLQGAVKVTAAIYQNGVLKSISPVLTLGAQRRTGLR